MSHVTAAHNFGVKIEVTLCYSPLINSNLDIELEIVNYIAVLSRLGNFLIGDKPSVKTSTMTCLILIKDIPLSSDRRAIDAVGMRTVTRVYRPYEILKGIRHCRLLGLSRDRRLSRHSYS